jgi:hypothetical protein
MLEKTGFLCGVGAAEAGHIHRDHGQSINREHACGWRRYRFPLRLGSRGSPEPDADRGRRWRRVSRKEDPEDGRQTKSRRGPETLMKLMGDKNKVKAGRVMQAMIQMH